MSTDEKPKKKTKTEKGNEATQESEERKHEYFVVEIASDWEREPTTPRVLRDDPGWCLCDPGKDSIPTIRFTHKGLAWQLVCCVCNLPVYIPTPEERAAEDLTDDFSNFIWSGRIIANKLNGWPFPVSDDESGSESNSDRSADEYYGTGHSGTDNE